MRIHKPISIVLFFILVLSSCYTVKYTHNEAMNSVLGLTKSEVIKNWGIPSDKRIDGKYEEWFYDFGTRYITYSGPQNVQSNKYGRMYYTTTAQSYALLQFTDYRVTGWQTKGVDYEKTEMNKGKTAIAAVVLTAITITLGMLLGGIY